MVINMTSKICVKNSQERSEGSECCKLKASCAGTTKLLQDKLGIQLILYMMNSLC